MRIQHLYKQVQDGNGLFYAWFPSMHTRIDLMFYDQKSEEKLIDVIKSIYDELCLLEKTANYYDANSELAQINRTAYTHPIPISHSLYSMISMCLSCHQKTLGCFDITIHSDAYNKDTIHLSHLSSKEQTIFFEQKGITINLSGFLKGYALEKIRSILQAQEIKNALINLGNSSVLALGNHPNGEGWKVSFGNQINTPEISMNQVVFLHNECLTTSGNDTNERRHIISPQNGQLLEGVKQVAVVTNDGIIGEILSTSLFIANQQQRQKLTTEFQPRLIIDL